MSRIEENFDDLLHLGKAWLRQRIGHNQQLGLMVVGEDTGEVWCKDGQIQND